MVIYEELLGRNLRHAMNEGSRYFEERSAVQDALRKITQRLGKLGIRYAVAGGIALFVHGFRRFTEDVDILVSGEDLRTIHQELEGLGYVLPFAGSKNLRDAASGVRIEFLVAGQYPGDGKPKPVAFPKPDEVAVERDGIQYLNLPTLIELKLASGMTSPGRAKDLVDVQELIKLLTLREGFANCLSPYVQAKYSELWAATRQQPTRYLTLWRNESLATQTRSLDEMIVMLGETAHTLRAMQADGVTLDPESGTDGHVYLVTTDPAVAKKYDMHDEAEFWGAGGFTTGGR